MSFHVILRDLKIGKYLNLFSLLNVNLYTCRIFPKTTPVLAKLHNIPKVIQNNTYVFSVQRFLY